VLVFALAMGLRLARFNAMIDVDSPSGSPTTSPACRRPPAPSRCCCRCTCDGLGLFDVQLWPVLVSLYVLAMAFLLVSTIPTFSGKLMGERISREYVMPMFVGVAAVVALLVTYPYGTLTLLTRDLARLHPLSYRRFQQRLNDPLMQPYHGAGTGARHPRRPTPACRATFLPGAGDTQALTSVLTCHPKRAPPSGSSRGAARIRISAYLAHLLGVWIPDLVSPRRGPGLGVGDDGLGWVWETSGYLQRGDTLGQPLLPGRQAKPKARSSLPQSRQELAGRRAGIGISAVVIGTTGLAARRVDWRQR
jgi:hypothetical protein